MLKPWSNPAAARGNSDLAAACKRLATSAEANVGVGSASVTRIAGALFNKHLYNGNITINHMKTSILSPSNPNPYDSINHTDWDLMEIGWMLIRDSEEKT